jgi:transposase InsO family protein
MFVILHVPGPENVVPDSLSRLVPRLHKPHANEASTDDDVGSVDDDQHSVHGVAGKPTAMLVVSALHGGVVEEIPDHAYDVIKGFHNELVGHFGIDRTIAMLTKAGFTWEDMQSHVRSFVQQCPLCQKLSYVRPSNIASPFSTGGGLRPMDRWCVDALEVLETESGFKFVLAFLDCFTRWIELYPLKSLEAQDAARCLIDIIGRYGAPRELLSDRGSQFVNTVIAAVLRSVGSSHVLAMAYSHEENGRIERANREILRHLRAFVMHSKVADDWVDKLPFVQRIMNASVHTVTGYSPAALLFGNAIDLNRGIFPENPVGSSREEVLPVLGVDSGVEFYSTWVAQRNEMQLQVLEASAELQQAELERHLQSVAPGKVTVFDDGTWVLVLPRNNSLTGRRRTGDKLAAFWDGPMLVVSHEGNAYTLHDTVEDKQVARHVTELKPFLFNPTRVDPREVARIDRREFLIETIIGHRGDIRRKSDLEFEVKWTGYSADYNLWLPWNQLMHTAQLREYLARVGLLNLLPKSSR